MSFRSLSLSFVAILVASRLDAHPLHTSLAELSYDSQAKEIRVSLRVFVDDLSKASSAYAASHPRTTESPILAYARAQFQISDWRGHLLSLASCGGKRVNDMMWICFHSPLPGGASGLRVSHRILFDLYSDQINIVQADVSGRRMNLLFTRGDAFKRLDQFIAKLLLNDRHAPRLILCGMAATIIIAQWLPDLFMHHCQR